MNKKGNAILDGLTILVVIFIFATISIFAYKAFDEVNADIISDPDMTLSEATHTSSDLHGKYAPLLDNLILFAFTLFIMFTLVSVFMLDTHPIFFIISVMLLIGLFLVSILLANTYDDMFQDDDMATYANQFTYTTWIMTHLLELFIVTAFIITIALFIKFKG